MRVNRRLLEQRMAAAVRYDPSWRAPRFVDDPHSPEPYHVRCARHLLECGRGMTIEQVILKFKPSHESRSRWSGRAVRWQFRRDRTFRVSAKPQPVPCAQRLTAARRGAIWFAIDMALRSLQPFMIARLGDEYVVGYAREIRFEMWQHTDFELLYDWSPWHGTADDPGGAGSAAPPARLSRTGDALSRRE